VSEPYLSIEVTVALAHGVQQPPENLALKADFLGSSPGKNPYRFSNLKKVALSLCLFFICEIVTVITQMSY
jgi:hypothetical protein